MDLSKALARWLRGIHDSAQRIAHRLEEAGFLLGDVDAELTALRKQGARWADRIDPPPADLPFDERDTQPIVVARKP